MVSFWTLSGNSQSMMTTFRQQLTGEKTHPLELLLASREGFHADTSWNLAFAPQFVTTGDSLPFVYTRSLIA